MEKPVILMPPNIRFVDLCSILDFAYLGHANVPHDRLNDFLKAGELFQIRGIKEGRIHFMSNQPQQIPHTTQVVKTTIVPQQQVTTFDPVITSTQESLRPTAKRPREDDDDENITLQEASEIMKMLLEDPELEEHPIKAETIKPIETEQRSIILTTTQTSQPQQTQVNAQAVKPKFLCRFCGRGLSTKGRVNKHENECNDNPNREIISCEICQLELKPSSLNHHMNSKHGLKNGGKTPKHSSFQAQTPSPEIKVVMTSAPSTLTTSNHQLSPDGNEILEKSPTHKIEAIMSLQTTISNESEKVVEKTDDDQINVEN
jgi:hypothetical protein